ncbi:MAG: GTPase Era [Rikenellaceae bacterium]
MEEGNLELPDGIINRETREPNAPHKSGFVNIIGNPNVGKSTLMNALVGERLSIITSKAQTTRHRIMGIVNGDDFQIIYSDTPGILKPNYRLQESMMRFVTGAISDADVIIYVTDTVEDSARSEEFLDKISHGQTPTILVINKIDLTTPEHLEELVAKWSERLPHAVIVPTSAKETFNIGGLFDMILERLPQGEPFYPKDTLTDKTLRFFATEIIREKILLNYDKEIPYSCEVAIEEYKEDISIDRISATIYVARDSQKGIIIGHKGERLKRVGTQARKDLELFLDKKVFLQLYVKVMDNWRDSDKELRRFGYEE